ncbi:MAG: hypothetical protein IT492_22310 [Gammaproteobacteria bacterium]|nr:hypothetical protein [Gammaproteobacteria bacterium]
MAFALGLGPLQATSALNEPFKGRIEVLGAKAEDFEALTVGLAGEEQFRRAGIERSAALFQLKFSVADTQDGKDYITVSSRDAIREPFLNFLLELNWANGRLLREYTVLLDPPLYDPNRRMSAAPAASRGPRAAAMPAPVRPAATPVARSTAPVSPAARAAAPVAAKAAPRAASGELGPVGAGDTLWSLARSARTDDSVSIQQMMLAILRQNPEAFSNGNVNMLRRGAVLHVPDDATIRAVSAKEAAAEIRHQHQLWEEYRHHAGAAPAAQPLGAPAAAAAAAPAPAAREAAAPAAPASDAKLELVAPGGTAAGAADGKPGKPGAAGTVTGDAKLVHDEALDSSKQQAGDLKDRLSEAEEIINILQRQVNIKDQELASLQARLAELGVKQGDLGKPVDATATGAAPVEAGKPAAEAPAATEVAPETTAEAAPAAAAAAPAASAAAETPAAAEIEPEIDVDGGKTAEAAKPAEAAAPAAPETEPEIEVATPAASAPGFPASLVPPAIAEMVPGGALGVLGIALLALLGLGAVVARTVLKGRGDSAEPVAVPLRAAPAVGSEDVTEASTHAAHDDDRTETPTNFDPLATTPSLPAFDPNATVVDAASEATAQPGAPETDPLEEVNVYLAYERFDQAEELVKRVIAQYPDRHEYKLRLLEVYYSSNDRVSYENAARELHAAVGDKHPLWESALAMWAEMSPDRALFAEGGALAATLLPASSAFVDITGSDSDATEATLTHAPGGHEGSLDFDLVGEATDTGTNNVLDLTAEDGVASADGEFLDLTATSELAETGDMGSVLDLTGGQHEAQFDIGASGVFDLTEGAGEANELLDITGGDGVDGSDLLDITGGAASADGEGDFLDLSGGSSDLLDVTKTGDVSMVDDLDLLNVTSSGVASNAQAVEADLDTGELDFDLDAELEAAPAAAEASTFDISDTVAPVFTKADIDEDDILDITGGNLAVGAGKDDLEFDIGGLDIEDHPTVEMELPAVVKATGLDLDLTAGGGSSELDFDIAAGGDELGSAFDISESEGEEGNLEITMGTSSRLDGELSLKGDELDAIALDGHDDMDLDGDLDFDLDGTAEIDSIAGDETVDMASAVALRNSGLKLNSGTEDDGSLDELTLELDEALNKRSDNSHLETLSLDSLDIESDDQLDLGASQTIVMPVDHTIERQSAADEADTKLNLAKAYIELGDSDGARSILDEVAVEGTPAQQAEARTLLGRLKP